MEQKRPVDTINRQLHCSKLQVAIQQSHHCRFDISVHWLSLCCINALRIKCLLDANSSLWVRMSASMYQALSCQSKYGPESEYLFLFFDFQYEFVRHVRLQICEYWKSKILKCRKFFKFLSVANIPSFHYTPMDPNYVLKHLSTAFPFRWRFAFLKLKAREEYLKNYPHQKRLSANLYIKTFHIADDFQIRKHCTSFKKQSALLYIYKNPNVVVESTDREYIKFVIEDLVEFVVLK